MSSDKETPPQYNGYVPPDQYQPQPPYQPQPQQPDLNGPSLPQALQPTEVQFQVAPETICNNSGNEAMYPVSARVYNEMCLQLGGQNVKPIPDYLTDEKLRKAWLKRGENALLYFLYRKDHYREKLQKMSDSSLCCFGCDYEPSSKFEKETVTPCNLFCLECCGALCCLIWASAPGIRSRLYATEHVSPHAYSTGICCSCCCGGVELRQVIAQRLSRMGVRNANESECYSCCVLCCCFTAPCAQVQSTMTILWLANKRYGTARPFQDILDEAKDFPQYQEYLRRIRADSQHPYSRAQAVLNYRYGRQTTTVNEREWTLQMGYSSNDLGHEFYHLKGAIRAHNKYWENYHRIHM